MAVDRHCPHRLRLPRSPAVPPDRTTPLLRRWAQRREPAVRERLITAYTPMARALAHRFTRRGEPLDDLVQVALIGLMHALDHYDPERCARFESYAVPTILGHLKRHFRDHTWSIRLPRDLR
jgi:RNA polymerase sigma-B factor